MKLPPPMPHRVGLGSLLVCLLLTGTASADHLVRPDGLFHEVTSREHSNANALVAELRAREDTRASGSKLSGAQGPTRTNFRRALGTLIVTRDLAFPGFKTLGFRLIPTKRALGGDANIPFVFQLRLSSHRMGLDVGGRF